ncbi:MAG: MlaD family protein [Verrucomicrobiae bacterium]|nr:MlaD family protein [Verrucomicrobiae bacterium]
MAQPDLTPQLRTRLNRMERAVGWFVLVAAALLLAGFGYYLRNTAQRKGWFTPKLNYETSLNNAAGLKVGDPVKLMGFPVGAITDIIPNEPDAWFGVTVNFTIRKPNYGYIWDDSRVKVSSDLLGNRFLEITKGVFGVPTVQEDTNRVALQMLDWQAATKARREQAERVRREFPELEQTNLSAFNWRVKDELERLVHAQPQQFYTNLQESYWIMPLETPAVSERLEQLINQVEATLPGLLNLTNKINATLDQGVTLISNLNLVAGQSQPVISNLARLSEEVRGPGALGEWALGVNGRQQLDAVLLSADRLLTNTDTNLTAVLEQFGESLNNLAEITGDLRAQVAANTNILTSVSEAVVHADDFVQGLKRHWLFRSAFSKKSTSDQPAQSKPRVTSPRNGGFDQ